MIPTKKLNDLNYDFNPFDNNSVSLAVTGVSIDALALNHGTLVPPSTSIVQSY
ncbi:hypothetical protein D3C71_2247520 [compost metagenome]